VSEFWAVVGKLEPFALFLLLLAAILIVGNLLAWPFRLANRVVRHLNIRKAGWPPEHLDADGDYKRKEEAEP
jgi:hypothetical protein